MSRGIRIRGARPQLLPSAVVPANPPYVWLALGVAIALLVFLGGPVLTVAAGGPSRIEALVIYVDAACFVAVYLWAIPADLVRRDPSRVAAAVVMLATVGVAMALIAPYADWTAAFIVMATAAGRISPPRTAIGAVAAVALMVSVVRFLAGAAAPDAAESAFEVVLTGLVVLSFSQLERAARALAAAQAEVARLAAADERARIARDVHDLLGHSLSVIALKTELVGRLLDRDPERAAAELREVEAVVRGSLRDVREAVAGYRRVRLETELDGARLALSAAGISVDVEWPAVALDETTDGVLGWAVREGVTNVVRHSGADRASIRLAVGDEDVRLEIIDNGKDGGRRRGDRSTAGERRSSGSGLAGIRERVEAIDGRMKAGRLRGGGYRLAVTVPARFGATSLTAAAADAVLADEEPRAEPSAEPSDGRGREAAADGGQA